MPLAKGKVKGKKAPRRTLPSQAGKIPVNKGKGNKSYNRKHSPRGR